MRRRTWILILIALAVAVPYYWLLIDNSAPAHAGPAPKLDIDELRRMANAMPGAKPVAVRYEIVATRLEPGALLVAGGGLKRQAIGAIVFMLKSPSGDTVIDSGMALDESAQAGFKIYSPHNNALVQQALHGAAHIVFTSERLDAMGGFLGSPDFAALAPKVTLGNGQSPQDPNASTLKWPTDLSGLAMPRDKAPLRAVAPGIVQIHAPAVSPGAQMYFVRFADGHEMLFAGEILPMRRNLDWMRLRSHYDTELRRPSNRGAQRAWLDAIAALAGRAPRLVIVPGRDQDWLGRKDVGPMFGRPASEGFVSTDDE